MTSNEEVEQAPPPAVDERKTRELCGAERDGLRCMRPRGHASEHEAFKTAEPITWSP